MLPQRSSRVPQILTRRSQSALGFWTASWAAENGHLHILEYLVERKYDKYSEVACANAAKFGHLDCLKYLHETAKAPWNETPYAARTRTTTPNVYNTSSTITVLSHLVGDTRMELYTHHSHHSHHHTSKSS